MIVLMVYYIYNILSSNDYKNGADYATTTLDYCIGAIVYLVLILLIIVTYSIFSVIEYKKRGGLTGTIESGAKIGTTAAVIAFV